MKVIGSKCGLKPEFSGICTYWFAERQTKILQMYFIYCRGKIWRQKKCFGSMAGLSSELFISADGSWCSFWSFDHQETWEWAFYDGAKDRHWQQLSFTSNPDHWSISKAFTFLYRLAPFFILFGSIKAEPTFEFSLFNFPLLFFSVSIWTSCICQGDFLLWRTWNKNISAVALHKSYHCTGDMYCTW